MGTRTGTSVYKTQTLVYYKESQWQDENKRKAYLAAKKDFRKRKIFNQKLKRNRTFRLVDELFKKNKDNFWKKIARMERNGASVNIDIEKIK